MRSTGERTKMFHHKHQKRRKPDMTQITNWTGRHWLLVDTGKIAIDLAKKEPALSMRDAAC